MTGNFEMIHDPDNEVANTFRSLLDSFGLTQSVDEPTLEFRHTLNLIVSHGLSQGTSGHPIFLFWIVLFPSWQMLELYFLDSLLQATRTLS